LVGGSGYLSFLGVGGATSWLRVGAGAVTFHQADSGTFFRQAEALVPIPESKTPEQEKRDSNADLITTEKVVIAPGRWYPVPCREKQLPPPNPSPKQAGWPQVRQKREFPTMIENQELQVWKGNRRPNPPATAAFDQGIGNIRTIHKILKTPHESVPDSGNALEWTSNQRTRNSPCPVEGTG